MHHPPVIQESNEDNLSPKQPSKEKQSFVPLDDSRLTLSEKLQQEDRRPSSDPVNISHSSVLSGSYIGDMARSLCHYEHDHFLSFAHVRHGSSLPNMQNGEIFMEERKKSNDEASDKNTEIVSNIKPDHEISSVNKAPPLHSASIKETLGNEESQEIQNFMENPVTMTTELEDSDDSHTLTDDSVSPDGDFQFPPIEEVDSVSASPVVVSHCEPVTVSDTFTNKMSVLRPAPRSSHRSSPKQKSSEMITNTKKSKDVPNDTGKAQIIGSQSQRSHNSASISNSESLSAEADANIKESFTESLLSNISFPSPEKHSMAILPISSSAVDMIVILQRLVGTGKIFCRTFSPIRRALSSEPSIPITSSSEEEINYQPMNYKCRQKLYDGFLDVNIFTYIIFIWHFFLSE